MVTIGFECWATPTKEAVGERLLWSRFWRCKLRHNFAVLRLIGDDEAELVIDADESGEASDEGDIIDMVDEAVGESNGSGSAQAEVVGCMCAAVIIELPVCRL